MSGAFAEPPLLALRDVEVVYDGIVVALHGVSLDVPARSIVATLSTGITARYV